MKTDIAVRTERRASRALTAALFALFVTSCSGGGQQAVTPKSVLAQRGATPNFRTQTTLQTPKSVSPASVAAQPMPRTAVLPAAEMLGTKRRPQSEIVGVGFTQIPGSARDVAVSPDGSLWVTSGVNVSPLGSSIWHYVNGTWTNIPGLATRLAVGPDTSLWAVNGSGGIYHYVGGTWTTIAGGAQDISVGPDGSVYVISNVAGDALGNGIWHYLNGTWTQFPGSAVRIAASWDAGSYTAGLSGPISPGGFYLTNGRGQIFYDSPSVGYVQLSGAAVAVAPTTRGGLFALGYPAGSGIFYNNLSTGTWTQQPGAATAIATNADIAAVVNAQGAIYTSGSLSSIIRFSSGISARAEPWDITAGPDGNLWFTELNNGIGRITPAGVVTEFTAGISPGADITSITAGPDGNLWFTETSANLIGRITPQGAVTGFFVDLTINGQGPEPTSITAGPDGNLWFIEGGFNEIGVMTPAGDVVAKFGQGFSGGGLGTITNGPDGNLWFTDYHAVGKISPAGVVTEFSAGISPNAEIFWITTGPDGNLWFTEANTNRIGRITPAGDVTEFPLPSEGFEPNDITAGPDGNLWFTAQDNAVGRITPAGIVTEFSAGTLGASFLGITAGPDGNLWFTDETGNTIDRI